MNWCKTHWDELRKGVDEAGLGHLVPRGGAAAAKAFAGGGFDPLMTAWLVINEEVARQIGPFLDCPCCIMERQGHPEMVQTYILGALNVVAQDAIRGGHIKPC